MHALRMLLLAIVLPLASSVAADDAVFDAEGVRLRYVERGGADAEPLVLLHGFSRNVELTWVDTGLLDALAESRRVIALDCRGHGRSEKPHDPDAYGSAMVEDVRRLLDHLGIERADLVGYSMGGRIALKFAAVHPDRVRRLVLLGAGGARPGDSRRRWDEVASALARGEGIRPLIRDILPDAPPETVDAINRQTLAANDPVALASVARAYGEFATTEEELDAMDTPILAVVGTEDCFRPDVQRLKRLKPEVEVVTIEGANHVTALERPELLEAVRTFLAGDDR